ncbi:MAG TPA: class I SAM-dependent methyltransferase [Candidatus Binataceae bacterium]|nr:class I SAM-dependent methyltransferase [Candidatus Binataceae bacterium]
MALYDSIGRSYDTTRKADPGITRRLARHLNLRPGAPYLDVACGTGNYTVALQNLGAQMHGIELATTMLDKAQPKSDRVRWIQGNAQSLPFRERSFAGATCTLAIHHMKDTRRVFAELFRVIDSGRFVIFTADHPQMDGYWLKEYFPNAIAAAIKQMPSANGVVHHLRLAGFNNVETEPWEVPRDLQDWFLYAGKHRPEIYLDPAVRAGTSFFAQGLATAEETAAGCQQLADDIKSGRIEKVAKKYRHNLGDYLFVIATKA